jgi:ubiquinone/menaquinone biosynthesis C-methylase UbiE
MSTQYVFDNSQDSSELKRLQSIEQIFDPASKRRILSTGITDGWRCLEVGAGAGSIARWMSEVVGEMGKVVAVDLDTRFIANINLPNVDVIKEDIQNLSLDDRSFDLIHARYVLIHIPNFRLALTKMLQLLKPNGWLVLEEPDFSAARAIAGQEIEAVNRVNQSILQMFENRGMDYAFGVKLPAILQEFDLQLLSVETDAHLANGGSDMANMMKMSALQLAEKYVSTGKSTHEDIKKYCLFAEDKSSWSIYYATAGVVAQKTISLKCF